MGFAGEALERFIESMIFYPDPMVLQSPADYGLHYEDIRFEAEDGVTLHGWMVPADDSEALLLFCHGNAGNISHRLDNIVRLNSVGLGVFIFDYRGYGHSSGQISEKGFYRDSDAAYKIARLYATEHGLKLVIFGRSLGGIAAVHVASANECSGVILESTFTNLAAMAKSHFHLPFADSLLEKRFNAKGSISRVGAPLLFFHGDCDEIVPYRCGVELYEAAPEPKEFVTLAGATHNDTYLVGGAAYFAKIKAFVEGLPSRTAAR